MNINQENERLADEYGIPRLRANQQQKGYNEIHFRNCTKLVWGIMLINVALILILLFVFFSRPLEHYYATSFSGDVTLLKTFSLTDANTVTQQNKLPESPTP